MLMHSNAYTRNFPSLNGEWLCIGEYRNAKGNPNHFTNSWIRFCTFLTSIYMYVSYGCKRSDSQCSQSCLPCNHHALTYIHIPLCMVICAFLHRCGFSIQFVWKNTMIKWDVVGKWAQHNIVWLPSMLIYQ